MLPQLSFGHNFRAAKEVNNMSLEICSLVGKNIFVAYLAALNISTLPFSLPYPGKRERVRASAREGERNGARQRAAANERESSLRSCAFNGGRESEMQDGQVTRRCRRRRRQNKMAASPEK